MIVRTRKLLPVVTLPLSLSVDTNQEYSDLGITYLPRSRLMETGRPDPPLRPLVLSSVEGRLILEDISDGVVYLSGGKIQIISLSLS